MHRPVKIENMKKKIHARARKVLWHEIGNFVWVSGSGREEVRGSRKKFSRGEGRAKGRVRFLQTSGSAELRKVASGSATQGLWLGNGKVGSQVIGENQSRLPKRGAVGEVRRGGRCGRRPSDRTKKRIHRFGRERRASRLPCLSLGLGGDRRSTSGSRDVSLTIFITSVSCRESLTFFTNRLFHFSRPPGFRRAFDGAERNGKIGRIQCQRSK